jgi:Bacterial aa3 type cytochrome c oxidase subunit IV
MADHHSHAHSDHGHSDHGHPAMDYAEHDRTFELFLTMTKWATIGVVGVVVLMAITLL